MQSKPAYIFDTIGQMALTSTMYNFDVDLADNDREVYQALHLKVAMHPSETVEFMLTRLMAYCLEYDDLLTFSKGLAEADEPAVWSKHLDGRIRSWIEVGVPDWERLHKAAKLAERVAVYTHKDPEILLLQLSGKRIHRASQIPVYSLAPDFLRDLAGLVERRTSFSLSVSEKQIYMNLGGRNLFSEVVEQRLV